MADTNGAPAFTLSAITFAAAVACSIKYGVLNGPNGNTWVVGPFVGAVTPDTPLTIDMFEVPATVGTLGPGNKHLFAALVDAPDGIQPDRPPFHADATLAYAEPLKYGVRNSVNDNGFVDSGHMTIGSGAGTQAVSVDVPAGTGMVQTVHGTPNFAVMVQPN